MSIFKSLKYYAIVSFDFGVTLTDEYGRKNLIRNARMFFPEVEVKEENYDDRIYDCEFIEYNKGKEPIVLRNLAIRDLDQVIQEFGYFKGADKNETFEEFTNYCSKDLSYYIVLDSYGIGTVNFYFIAEDISVDNSIKVLKKFENLVDTFLYPNCLSPKINSLLHSTVKSRSPVLKEHHTYHVLVNNSPSKAQLNTKKCYGIVWKDLNYDNVKNLFASEISQNIAKDVGDIVIIGKPAALLCFSDATYEGRFVASHVMAIELLRRQHHLLKKFDFKLSDLGTKDGSNPRRAINEIVVMQKHIIGTVDYFLKTKGFATQEFAKFVNQGVKVFGMVDLYDNLWSKLNISYKIVSDLIQRNRNRLLYMLQLIGLLFASISLTIYIIHPLLLRVYLAIGHFMPIQKMLGTFWIPLGDLVVSMTLALGGFFLTKGIDK